MVADFAALVEDPALEPDDDPELPALEFPELEFPELEFPELEFPEPEFAELEFPEPDPEAAAPEEPFVDALPEPPEDAASLRESVR